MKLGPVIGWLLLPASLAVAAFSFFWLASAALPYQDPTPAMLAAQQEEIRRALSLLIAGTVAAVACALWLWKSFKRRPC